MTKLVIDAREALLDIWAGTDHHRLMAKYNLSEAGLRSLLRKLADAGLLDRFDHWGNTMSRGKGPVEGRDVYLGEIARDVKAGLSDPELMKKYGMSALGLAATLRHLSISGMVTPRELLYRGQTKRTIALHEIVSDIRSGMSEARLMEKYQISEKKLGSLYGKLLDSGAVTRTELIGWGRSSGRAVRQDLRREPRNLPVFELPVYELGRPKSRMSVEDITENGVRVLGAEALVDEVKLFTMLPTDLCNARPLAFTARCRWIGTDDLGSRVAGFEIPTIDRENLTQLRTLIEEVTVRFEN